MFYIFSDTGIVVKDFGVSWRDGVAFLGLIDAIKANLVNLAELRKTNNRYRLETAFNVAEDKLGIAKLLDAEDVDVAKPDEKSIMTYVAQFLHKYPEPKGTTSKDYSQIQQGLQELLAFLTEKNNEYEPMLRNGTFPRDFGEYLISRSELDARIPTFHRIMQFFDTQNANRNRFTSSIPMGSAEELNNLWHRVQYQLMSWLWLLDSELPNDFGEVGKWLAEGERLLLDTDDIPSSMDEETAGIIGRKLEEHKQFFSDYPRVLNLFENARQSSSLAQQIPLEQLYNMERRLKELPAKANERKIRLKFLEHKCCLIAFLNLVEQKMAGWTGKYGTEDRVRQQLDQYKNFVSKNKIFQEFEKAYIDMKQVASEYKEECRLNRRDINNIDRFMHETDERWKRVSMGLKCCQNSLEEVANCWETWNRLQPICTDWLNRAEPKILPPTTEDERLLFFQDISDWKDRFDSMANAVNYLMASCEDQIAVRLRQDYGVLAQRFERLFIATKKYVHAGDILRARQEYKQSMDKLSHWLLNAQNILNQDVHVEDLQQLRVYGDELQRLACQIDDNEELFKISSRNIKSMIPELSRDEVDSVMGVLKQEKEHLINIRGNIPGKLHLIHQLLIQLESLEKGIEEINKWLDEAKVILQDDDDVKLASGFDSINEKLNAHKIFFSRTVYYRSMLESKNKVLQNVLSIVRPDGVNIDVSVMALKMQDLNTRFNDVIGQADRREQSLHDLQRNWNLYKDRKHILLDWLREADNMLQGSYHDTLSNIEKQQLFFRNVNEQWIQDVIASAQNLLRMVPSSERQSIIDEVDKLQKDWQRVLGQIPQHLLALDFRLEEMSFRQLCQHIEKELVLEEQALGRNEDVDSILRRHQQFFGQQNMIDRIEHSLENMQKILQTWNQRMNTTTTSSSREEGDGLQRTHQSVCNQWNSLSQRIAKMRETLQQIPAQWDHYRDKFHEMNKWMDLVDNTLRNIVNEVNSMEDFEKEKVIFQVSR